MSFRTSLSGLKIAVAAIVMHAEASHAGPADGEPRAFIATGTGSGMALHESASASAQILVSLPAGVAVLNLGCRDVGGRVWCEVSAISGGVRGFVPADLLTPAAGPDGVVATGPDTTARRAEEGQFDAFGVLPCAPAPNMQVSGCAFQVASSEGGWATLIVILPDGRRRVLPFVLGRPTRPALSDGPTGVFSATRSNGILAIRVGPESFVVPEAALFAR